MQRLQTQALLQVLELAAVQPHEAEEAGMAPLSSPASARRASSAQRRSGMLESYRQLVPLARIKFTWKKIHRCPSTPSPCKRTMSQALTS